MILSIVNYSSWYFAFIILVTICALKLRIDLVAKLSENSIEKEMYSIEIAQVFKEALKNTTSTELGVSSNFGVFLLFDEFYIIKLYGDVERFLNFVRIGRFF